MSKPKANKTIALENARLKLAYSTIVEKHKNAELALEYAIELLEDSPTITSSNIFAVKDIWANGEDSEFYGTDSDESN